MSILEHIPAIIRVIMVFILVLVCIRKNLSLGNAFLLGAIFLSALFGLKPLAMLKSMVASIIDPKTLSIAGIVALILVLSNSMERAGQMQRLLDRFRGLVSSPRLNLAIFPDATIVKEPARRLQAYRSGPQARTATSAHPTENADPL